MPTTGTVLAKNMAIYTGSPTHTIVACQTNATLSMSTNTFETTCKDAGAWADSKPGTKSWTMSGEGNLAFDASNGFSALFSAWTNQTSIVAALQTGVTGDKKYVGSGYITSLELNSSGNDEPVTFSFELTGVMGLSEVTI